MFIIPRFMGRLPAEVATFLNHFARELLDYAADLGLSDEEVLYVAEGAALYDWLERVHSDDLTRSQRALIAARDELASDKMGDVFTYYPVNFTPMPVLTLPIRQNFVGYIDNLVKRIRLSEGYGVVIGRALGIEGKAAPVVTPDKAVLAALRPMPNFQMQVRARRYGAKMVLFYDMADPQNPVLLAGVASGIWVDQRPPSVPGQMEIRSYAVRYADGQARPLRQSEMSNILIGTVMP